MTTFGKRTTMPMVQINPARSLWQRIVEQDHPVQWAITGVSVTLIFLAVLNRV